MISEIGDLTENSVATTALHARSELLRVKLVFEHRLPSTSWLRQSEFNSRKEHALKKSSRG